MDLITSLTSQVMHKAMDGLSKRHTALASNLANVDTPHYRRRDISFEGALQKAIMETKGKAVVGRGQASNDIPMTLRTADPKHIAIGRVYNSIEEVQPDVAEVEDLEYRQDGNSVDVESEMSQLAKNTQKYLAITNIQGRNMRSIRSIISGGGA